MSIHALVVDEKLKDLSGCVEELRAVGYTIVLVNSLQQAREAFASQSFDVLLLDVLLRDGHALQFCDEVRTRFNRDAVIILVGANDERARQVAGLELGADDFVSIPCAIDELLARIEAHLRRQRRVATGPADG